MLKRRLIPKILARPSGSSQIGYEACISQKYSNLKGIGSLKSQLRIFESNKADELLVINVDKTKVGIGIEFVENIGRVIDFLSTPMMVGGGITSVEDAKALVNVGVDKVICGISGTNHKLHSKIASTLGSQALTISIDYTLDLGQIVVGHYNPAVFTEKKFLELIKEIEASGAGEIVLNRIDFDGMKLGLDIQTLKTVGSITHLPIVITSGAGKPEDFIYAFNNGADAVATGTYFAKFDQNPLQLRSRLHTSGVSIRN